MAFMLSLFMSIFSFDEPPGGPADTDVTAQGRLGTYDECIDPPEVYIDGVPICPNLVSPA